MADDISVSSDEEMSGSEESSLKSKVVNGDAALITDEKVSSTTKSTSVSTGSGKSDEEVERNGEIDDSEGEDGEDDEEESEESEEDSESASEESYGSDEDSELEAERER